MNTLISNPEIANLAQSETNHENAYEKYYNTFWEACADNTNQKCAFEFTGRVANGNFETTYYKPVKADGSDADFDRASLLDFMQSKLRILNCSNFEPSESPFSHFNYNF